VGQKINVLTMTFYQDRSSMVTEFQSPSWALKRVRENCLRGTFDIDKEVEDLARASFKATSSMPR